MRVPPHKKLASEAEHEPTHHTTSVKRLPTSHTITTSTTSVGASLPRDFNKNNNTNKVSMLRDSDESESSDDEPLDRNRRTGIAQSHFRLSENVSESTRTSGYKAQEQHLILGGKGPVSICHQFSSKRGKRVLLFNEISRNAPSTIDRGYSSSPSTATEFERRADSETFDNISTPKATENDTLHSLGDGLIDHETRKTKPEKKPRHKPMSADEQSKFAAFLQARLREYNPKAPVTKTHFTAPVLPSEPTQSLPDAEHTTPYAPDRCPPPPPKTRRPPPNTRPTTNAPSIIPPDMHQLPGTPTSRASSGPRTNPTTAQPRPPAPPPDRRARRQRPYSELKHQTKTFREDPLHRLTPEARLVADHLTRLGSPLEASLDTIANNSIRHLRSTDAAADPRQTAAAIDQVKQMVGAWKESNRHHLDRALELAARFGVLIYGAVAVPQGALDDGIVDGEDCVVVDLGDEGDEGAGVVWERADSGVSGPVFLGRQEIETREGMNGGSADVAMGDA